MFSKLLDYFQDVDAQVTFEDQQKINKFARCNHRLQDVKEELAAKQVKNEPPHGKTNNLHRRKQWHRSASPLFSLLV